MFDLKHLFALLLCSVGVFVSQGARAAESYDNCTGYIDAVPATISTQGTWCLRKDLGTSISGGNAITINTNNVTINCNDFKLGGLGAGAGTFAIGIAAQERLNITVRRCNVRGFWRGVYLQGASGGGHLVEDNRLDGNTTTGIFVEGDGSTVRRNLVADTGAADPGNGEMIVGIYTLGSADLLDNAVSGVVALAGSNGWVSGISAFNNGGGSINGNRVRGLVKDGTGLAFGIQTGAGDLRVTLRDNDLVGNGTGVGMTCDESSKSRAMGNVINGFAFPLQCGDAGGNDTTL